MSQSGGYTTSTSLPADFVKHLRCVFETLDKEENGFIKVSDLEKYWQKHYKLKKSIKDSLIIKRLNEIAPYNMGLISFPRLCTGVKEAIMQAKIHRNRKISFIYALSLNGDSGDSGISDIADEDLGNVHQGTSVSPKVSRADHWKRVTCEKSMQDMLDCGISMVAQIKSWYTHQNLRYSSGETKELRREDLEKISQLNDALQGVLCMQQNKNTLLKTEPDQTKIVTSLKSKVAKLEDEKSVLIREMFQLKALLKTPTIPSIIDI